jgi:hypothetical protein
MVIMLTVDEFADGLLVGVTVRNEGLNNLQHLQGGLGEPDEDTIVDLQQAKELQSLALLRINLVDTLDTDDEGELVLGRDVKLVLLLGLTLQADLLTVGIAVLLDVLLSTLEDDLALLLALVYSWSAVARVIKLCHKLHEGRSHHSRKMVNDSNIARRLADVLVVRIIATACSSCPSTALQVSVPRFSFVAIARSSRALSCDLRFFSSVSGTRMLSCVGTVVAAILVSGANVSCRRSRNAKVRCEFCSTTLAGTLVCGAR